MAFLNVTYVTVPGASATAVTGVDGAGDIVGAFSENGADHGFIDRGGVFTTVDALAAGRIVTGTVVTGVSTSGVLFGTYATGTGDPTGFGKSRLHRQRRRLHHDRHSRSARNPPLRHRPGRRRGRHGRPLRGGGRL